MDSHLWFQQLRDALNNEGVPKRYADRLVKELWHHYLEMKDQDAMNGFSNNDNDGVERLGSPEILAAYAARVPQRTWSGRHPWLAFVFGAPMLAVGLILLSVLLAIFALLPFAEGKTLATDPWLAPVMSVLGPIQVIVPALLACLLLFRSVGRSVRSPWWGIAGCGLIALLCAMTSIQWAPAVSIPGTGRMSVGFSVPFASTWFQAIAPLIAGTIYALKEIPPRRPQQPLAEATQLRSAA